jgi:type-F conjugative transfer system pilin assembly protein TrbC
LEEKKLLPPLIFLLFLLSFCELGASCFQHKSCPSRLQEQSPTEQSSIRQPSTGQPLTKQFSTEDSLKSVEAVKQDKDFQSFLTEASQKSDWVLADPDFQDFVKTLHDQIPTQVPQLKRKSDHTNQTGELYIFVSFSLGEKALLNLTQEAKAYKATLVLRGFIKGSYTKTVKALQKIILETGQGVSIDPELFSLFNIKAVPTYVLSKPFQLNAQERTQTPLHDRIQGHVSLQYALEQFAKTGDLREEAQTLLEQRGIK